MVHRFRCVCRSVAIEAGGYFDALNKPHINIPLPVPNKRALFLAFLSYEKFV